MAGGFFTYDYTDLVYPLPTSYPRAQDLELAMRWLDTEAGTHGWSQTGLVSPSGFEWVRHNGKEAVPMTPQASAPFALERYPYVMPAMWERFREAIAFAGERLMFNWTDRSWPSPSTNYSAWSPVDVAETGRFGQLKGSELLQYIPGVVDDSANFFRPASAWPFDGFALLARGGSVLNNASQSGAVNGAWALYQADHLTAGNAYGAYAWNATWHHGDPWIPEGSVGANVQRSGSFYHAGFGTFASVFWIVVKNWPLRSKWGMLSDPSTGENPIAYYCTQPETYGVSGSSVKDDAGHDIQLVYGFVDETLSSGGTAVADAIGLELEAGNYTAFHTCPSSSGNFLGDDFSVVLDAQPSDRILFIALTPDPVLLSGIPAFNTLTSNGIHQFVSRRYGQRNSSNGVDPHYDPFSSDCGALGFRIETFNDRWSTAHRGNEDAN